MENEWMLNRRELLVTGAGFVAAGAVLYFCAPANAAPWGSAPAPVPNFVPAGSGKAGGGATGDWGVYR